MTSQNGPVMSADGPVKQCRFRRCHDCLSYRDCRHLLFQFSYVRKLNLGYVFIGMYISLFGLYGLYGLYKVCMGMYILLLGLQWPPMVSKLNLGQVCIGLYRYVYFIVGLYQVCIVCIFHCQVCSGLLWSQNSIWGRFVQVCMKEQFDNIFVSSITSIHKWSKSRVISCIEINVSF